VSVDEHHRNRQSNPADAISPSAAGARKPSASRESPVALSEPTPGWVYVVSIGISVLIVVVSRWGSAARGGSGLYGTQPRLADGTYRGRDFLQAVVVGGDAAWGAYSYISSVAGIAYLIWLLSTAVWMLAVGTHPTGGQPSVSDTGG
jgi:hypothetical protein